jgi:hypothetical protein
MLTLFRWKVVPAVIAGLAVSVVPMVGQMPTEGPVPTTALITVESKNGVALNPSMMKLQVNRHDAPITSVTPVTPAAAQVAILIDDGLRFTFGSQISDFAEFINQLPAGTKVMLGYMQNGTVRASSGFTADHAAVAKQLRIPMSMAGVDASPYFCLSEFVKHWPSNEPGARFVLLITNGIDPYNGRPSIMNQDSPYVQTAQEDAERAGVAVYSIYYGQSSQRGGEWKLQRPELSSTGRRGDGRSVVLSRNDNATVPFALPQAVQQSDLGELHGQLQRYGRGGEA